MKKISTFLFLTALAALPLRADLLFQDSTNYPYTDGCIEGQGQWYCYYPSTPMLDALVTNNVLFLNATNHDSVATPTNGWVNSSPYTFASFNINVSQLPSTANGGYFCQFQDNNDTNHCCHIFIDTIDTTLPGTYRLGIANYATSFSSLAPPHNFPMDMATNVNYTVVVLFDSSGDDFDSLVGATLWVNPSEQDFQNAANGDDIGNGIGNGFAFGNDTTGNQAALNMTITQIGFSPYANAGISNVMVGSAFDDVNTTNLPVIAIQPQPGTNYSGNSALFYSAASGVDLSYQWYSQAAGILHDDGVNFIGSTSNILVVNNLVASDDYYVVVTDAYGRTASSAYAAETVITTPTPLFFPASATPVSLTNNLFTSTGFTNSALGTGPISYQWYFAPAANPTAYAALPGENGPGVILNLVDYTLAGNYYVMATSPANGGSTAYGPTNSLTEIAPAVATLSQLHTLMVSLTNQIAANESGTVTINSNNVTVGGYVTTYGGFGNSYTEFFVQDAAGYGIEVYLAKYLGGFGTTNMPPTGSYVTITGQIVVYQTQLEIEPTSLAAFNTNEAPPLAIPPKLINASFNNYVTNGLGATALMNGSSMVTLTNIYIYGSKTGGPIGNGGIFYSNGYTKLYLFVGPYDSAGNTNYMTLYQFGSNFGTNVNPFADQPVPTYCSQLTGIYVDYQGTPEIEPSRLADYVVNPPAPFPAGLIQSNVLAGKKIIPMMDLSWPVQNGATYSVYTATNLLGPWTQAAYGLGYCPTNGSYSDTNSASAKFYQVTSP